MQVLCGIMKVQDYEKRAFSLVNRKWQADVDMSEKLYEFIDSLAPKIKVDAKEHIDAYLKAGPIDNIEIVVSSDTDKYTIINKVIYERLCRYIDADRRVVRIKFKFYNALERCTYVAEEVSGDYLLIPAWCKTGNEELAAIAWCREIIKSIVANMYNKYGTELSAEEALKRLEIGED